MSAARGIQSHLRIVYFLALWLVLALLVVRTAANERGYERLPRAAVSDTYVPTGYLDVVNREVAPHLELCPLDPQEAALLRPDLMAKAATNSAGNGTSGPSPCDASCAKDRLSLLFCLRTDGLPHDHAIAIRQFREVSPLQRDLRILDRWQLSTGPSGAVRVELRADAHRQALHVDDVRHGFAGRVLFRDSAPALVLADDVGNELIFAGAEHGAVASEATTRLALRELARRREAVAHGAAAEQRVIRAKVLTIHEGAQEIHLIAPTDDAPQVLVEVPQRAGGSADGLAASLEGARLDSEVKRRIVGLEDGQQLELRAGTSTLPLRLVRRQSAVLSEVRNAGEGRRRHHDESAGLGRYLDTLVGSLGDASRRLQEAAAGDFAAAEALDSLMASDVQLTLDSDLQRVAQTAVERYARIGPIANADDIFVERNGPLRGQWFRREMDGHSPTKKILTPPPVMTLTVMDADDGALLSLASYPSRPTIDTLVSGLGGVQDQPEALLREQLEGLAVGSSFHFKPHVIGSLVKVILAWGFGTSSAALLAVPVNRTHAIDWPDDPRNAEVVDQCLVPVGRDDSGRSFWNSAMGLRPLATGCDGRRIGPADVADICAAIGASDTYYFVRMVAQGIRRVLEQAQALQGSASPASPDFIDAACEPRRQTDTGGVGHTVCAAPRTIPTSGWFPARCDSDENPFCATARLFDIQVQAIGAANPVDTGASFLGPLHARLVEISNLVQGECSGIEAWSKLRSSGMLWALPRAPQWSQDLMTSCDQLTMFVQGGALNYWNNIFVAQAFARIATGRGVRARLVDALVPPDGSIVRQSSQPAPALDATQCATGDAEPRCRVLEGMRLAVAAHGGTLKKLAATEALLNDEARRDSLPLLELRGKTGSGGDLRPQFVWATNPATGAVGWKVRSARTASIHTALLARFIEPGGGRSRTFVVYLWVEGVDENFTSMTGAVPFFAKKGTRIGRSGPRLGESMPGVTVLRSLRARALADWR